LQVSPPNVSLHAPPMPAISVVSLPLKITRHAKRCAL
jgi:hypothetical protein